MLNSPLDPRPRKGRRPVRATPQNTGFYVVVTTRAGREDQADFDQLLADLRENYRPIGIAEDLLVQERVTSNWRSARAARCERGDLTRAGARPRQSELSEQQIALYTLLPAADAYHSLLESSCGIRFLLLKTKQIIDEVTATAGGRVSTELLRWLAPGKNWARFPTKESLLEVLEKEVEMLTAEKSQAEADESQSSDGWRDSLAIPSKEVLDRLHRYETRNVRHRYKVEARLDLLQARRWENAKVNSEENNDEESSRDAQFCDTKPTGSDDGGLRKGPHSVGSAGQTSDDSATPPVKNEVSPGELAVVDADLRNEANKI